MKENVEFWMPFKGVASIKINRLKDKSFTDEIKLIAGPGSSRVEIDTSRYLPGSYSCTLNAEGFELLVGSVQIITKFLKVFIVE